VLVLVRPAPKEGIVIVVFFEVAVNLYHTSKVVAAVAPPQEPDIAPSVDAEVAFCKFPSSDEGAGLEVLQDMAGVSVIALAQVLLVACE
jgi:hypothetical protein